MSDDRPRRRAGPSLPAVIPGIGEGLAEGIRTARPVPPEFWPAIALTTLVPPESLPPEGAGGFLHSMLGGSGPEPGPPYTRTLVPPSLPVLTSAGPEPPPGTIVRDDCGTEWVRYGPDEGDYWLPVDDNPDSDPESWSKIAGNYGPVTVLEPGEP